MVENLKLKIFSLLTIINNNKSYLPKHWLNKFITRKGNYFPKLALYIKGIEQIAQIPQGKTFHVHTRPKKGKTQYPQRKSVDNYLT